MADEDRNFVPDDPDFASLDDYERRRMQELFAAIDKEYNGTGKLDGTAGDEIVALAPEYRNEKGEHVSLGGSNHLMKFSLDLAKVKNTDLFGFYNILDHLRRKFSLTPLVFPHERQSLLVS